MKTLSERLRAIKRIRQLGDKIQALQLQEKPLENERVELYKAVAEHYRLDFNKVTNCKIEDAVIHELGAEEFRLRFQAGAEEK